MSTKRKRVTDSVEPVERKSASPAPAPSTAKKRKGRMTVAEKERRDVEIGKGEFVMAQIRKTKNSEKQSIVESLLRLPPRRVEPEFYDQIAVPIDITQIQQKLKNPEYNSFDEFCKDINLLVDNSTSYYKEGSTEYSDAQKIKEVFLSSKEKVDSGEYKNEEVEDAADDSSSSSGRDTATPAELDIHMIHDVIGAILEFTDSTGRLLCPPFRVLQSETEFPLYYEKIKEPIDLKTIAQKGRDGMYKSMNQLKNDLNLLFSNAQTFSGKGSDIYKDAEQLKQCVKEKIAKIEDKGTHPMRREKTLRMVDFLLIQSSLHATDTFSEDSEEDEDTESNSDPLWKIYWTVRNAKHEKDRALTLADHFLELPSKQFYPDYFDEIKTPVSLFMINKKLKAGGYEMKGLINDLIQMYANACSYNLESSEVYIAAKKLEALTLSTVRQLNPNFDLTRFEKRVGPQSPLKPGKVSVNRPKNVKIEMETDSDDGKTPPPAMKRKSPKKMRGENGASTGRGRKTHLEMNELMRNRHIMASLWSSIHQFKTDPTAQYWPAGAFISLPSMKQYPEYYQIIQNPVDLTMIKQRIDTNQYRTVEQMLEECRRMFANARDFNEPKSAIHQDAIRLETVLLRTYEAMRNAPAAYFPMPILQNSQSNTPQGRKHGPKGPRGTPKTDKGLMKRRPRDSDDEDMGSPGRKIRKGDRSFDQAMSALSEEEQKMWGLFQSIKNFREEEGGRPLAVNFMKLPAREEFPGYYDVIKKPMDMMRIQQKLSSKSYLTVLDMISDFTLMLSNACKFNEPDSDIYKEAVTLQRVLLEFKCDLAKGEKVPRVQVELRTIFTSIFASLFNKKDENGKCYSDALTELTEILKSKGVPQSEWPYTFDQIKINIDKCRYRRLDRFQKDLFDLFEKARSVAKTESPMYLAAIALQKAFIVERDARCKDVISSNAYIVIEKDIDESVKQEAAQRARGEIDDEEPSTASGVKRNESEIDVGEIEVDGVKYTAPSYAYISRTDEKKAPLHIMRIERVFKNENGDQAIQGFWVYRPEETIHLASRKFMKREVFITPFRDTVLLDRLRGKCMVVSYQTYTTKSIQGFDDEDIYLCEFKYHGKPKYFGKFKSWPYTSEDEKLECKDREKTLSPKRSVKVVTNEEPEEKELENEDSDDDDDDDRARDEVVLDIDRFETPQPSCSDNEPGKTYFHQIRSQTGKFFTLGQFVLVFNASKPLCDVMRINKLWREEDGTEWFSGGWFARPVETIHDKGRMFYNKEVVAVFRNDETRRLSEIQGLCDVMHPKAYVKQRQTDVAECDVFVCETMVSGGNEVPDNCSLFGYSADDVELRSNVPMNLDYAKNVRKLKIYKLHLSIPNEELFIFKQPITMEKEMSPLLKTEGVMPLDSLDELMDDDTDGSESIASFNTNHPPTVLQTPKPEVAVPTTPTPTPSQSSFAQPVNTGYPNGTPITVVNNPLAPISTPKTIKSKSGYILFSAEVRKRIMHENPEAGFGEVSKIVGIEWKKLSEEQKKHYEVRAEVVAQEKAKLDAIKAAQERTLMPGQQRIYQCKWANCDSQFDAESGLSEHIIQHHTSQIIMDSDQQFVCMWMTCLRNRKDGKPFPSLPRLHRHMKEKHMPTAMRNVYQNQIGKNFFKLVTTGEGPTQLTQLVNAPYGRLPQLAQPQQQQQQQMGGQQQINGINGHPHQQQQHQMGQMGGQPMMNGVPAGQQMIHNQQIQQQHDQHHQQQHQQYHPQQQTQQFQQQQNQHQQVQQNYQQQGVHQQQQIQHNNQIQHQQQMYQQGPSSSAQQFQHQVPNGQHAVHHVQQQQQQQQVQQVVISDPGRTIVRAIVPTFVAPPNAIHSRRVLHSEAYLKYIESLSSNRQKSVSRWEKSIGATHRNTQLPPNNGQNRLPSHWIRKTENGKPVAREDDVAKALWKLRDELLHSTCNILIDRQTL